MSQGILFAILAATAFGFWTVFHAQAANHINQLFGAVLISFTAVLIGTVLLLTQYKTVNGLWEPRGIAFAVCAGIMALGIDYFVLRAYSSDVPISIVGPIVIGGSIAIATIVGFFLGESITSPKVIGVLLVILGASLLSVQTA
jgi:uncharacterized membrane protein